MVRLLKRQGVPYMLMGGMALAVWGRSRFTHDVDLAIALPEKEFPHFLEVLKKAFFLPAPPRPMLGSRLIACRYLKPSKGLPVQVDLLLARGIYQEQALQRAVTVSLGSLHLRVVSPEDLILLKLLAGRPMDELDVLAVLQEQAKTLDRKYLKHWARHLGLAKQLSALSGKAPRFFP